jgi:hypothetical protein
MPKRTTTSETPITDDVTEIWKPNASHEGHAVRAVESHLAVWASHAPDG